MAETATAVIQTKLPSKKNKGYDEDYSGRDKSGISLYSRREILNMGSVWARRLYSAYRSDAVSAALSFMPGTYQGVKPAPVLTMAMRAR